MTRFLCRSFLRALVWPKIREINISVKAWSFSQSAAKWRWWALLPVKLFEVSLSFWIMFAQSGSCFRDNTLWKCADAFCASSKAFSLSDWIFSWYCVRMVSTCFSCLSIHSDISFVAFSRACCDCICSAHWPHFECIRTGMELGPTWRADNSATRTSEKFPSRASMRCCNIWFCLCNDSHSVERSEFCAWSSVCLERKANCRHYRERWTMHSQCWCTCLVAIHAVDIHVRTCITQLGAY